MFFEFSIDWKKELDRLLSGYTIVIPTAVVKELQILASRKTGQKKAVAALKLIEKYEIINHDAETADDALLQIAEKTKGIVVTNDKELRKRLKKVDFPVIFLRGKNKFVLDE